jgi:hypothetical protein
VITRSGSIEGPRHERAMRICLDHGSNVAPCSGLRRSGDGPISRV